MEKIKNISGIGEKTAERLIKHFKTEEKVLETINKQDILALSRVEGITTSIATQIVQNTNVKKKDFLKTKDVIAIHAQLVRMLQEAAHTQSAKNKMALFLPYPGKQVDEIREIQQEILKYIHTADKFTELEFEETNKQFGKIQPLKKSKTVHVKERVIITSSTEEYDKALSLREHIDVCLASTFNECVDIISGHTQALLLGTQFAGYDFPYGSNVEIVSGFEQLQPWQVVPEIELGFFAKNKETILASCKIAKIIKKYTDFATYFASDELEELIGLVNNLTGSGDLPLEDDEVARLKRIVLDIDSVAKELEKKFHADFSELVEKSSVTLEGREIFEAVTSGNELRYVLEKGLQKEYDELARQTMDVISTRLQLTSSEFQLIESLLPDELTYPLSFNIECLEELKRHASGQISSKQFEISKDYAKKLHAFHKRIERLVEEVIDFDTMYSVACFARMYNLNMPALTGNMGIAVERGINLFIGTDAVPIDYAVGDVPQSPGGSKRIILSGVNSGGKTTALDMLSQIVILSHMGFPVPAESAIVGLVDELFYFGKSKGSLGAGAFESTIKSFSAITSGARKIVFADELEAITEPGASARIIGGVLETAGPNTLTVFVSHLAELIMGHTDCELRVDGIEAQGLDDNLELVVERTPQYNHLAKSTPQLIVERLSKIETKHVDFYHALLKKFEE